MIEERVGHDVSLEMLRLISFKAAASVTDRIRTAVADTAELGLLVRYH